MNEALDFLVNVFVENGYNNDILMKLRNEYEPPEFRDTSDVEDETEKKATVQIPWLPKVSTKSKKIYKKKGLKVI